MHNSIALMPVRVLARITAFFSLASYFFTFCFSQNWCLNVFIGMYFFSVLSEEFGWGKSPLWFDKV